MQLIRIFTGAFRNPATYREARRPQSGTYLFYSFVLVLAMTAIIVVAGLSYMHHTLLGTRDGQPPLLDQFVLSQAEQIPVMTLQQGTLRVKAKQPYPLRIIMGNRHDDSQKEDFVWGMIDTTGATTMHNMKTPVLITAHEIYVQSNGDIRVFPLDKMAASSSAPMIINRAVVEDGARRILGWIHDNSWKIWLLLGIPAWIMFSLVTYALRLLMLMALALAGMMISRVYRPKLGFADAVRVAAVAYTPVAVFSALAFAYNATPISTLLLFGLGCLMLWAGLRDSRE